MSNGNKSAWEKLLEQISSPWDWAAVAVGAAGGAVFTIASGGADLGTFTATGATAALAARKAGSASLQRRWLRNRAEGLKKELERHINKPPTDFDSHEKVGLLIRGVEREWSLWESRATTNEDFAKQLDGIIQKYRDEVLITPRPNQLPP